MNSVVTVIYLYLQKLGTLVLSFQQIHMDDMVVTDFLLVEGQVDPLRASRLFGSIHFDRHPDCFSSTGRWLSTTSSWPANTACNNKCYKLIWDFPGSTMILRSSSSWNASRRWQKKPQVEYIEFIDDDPRVRRPARAATLQNQPRYLQLQMIATHEQVRMMQDTIYI